MAPGGAHPRCALSWKRLGAPSASAPRGEPEQRSGWTCRPGTTSTWRVGLSGTFRSRLRSPTCPRRKAVVPKDSGQTGSDRNPVRSLLLVRRTSQCFPPTRAGSPTLWTSRRRSCTTPRGRAPEGAEDLGPRPLRGATACVEWAGLLRLARRRQGPACRATPPFSSGLESPIGGSLQARACLAIAVPPEGGFGGSPSRPVAAAPFSSVRHVALA